MTFMKLLWGHELFLVPLPREKFLKKKIGMVLKRLLVEKEAVIRLLKPRTVNIIVLLLLEHQFVRTIYPI